MYCSKLIENPNFFDVLSDLPFSETTDQTFKERKSNNSSLEITVMPSVTLQDSDDQVVWIVFSSESSDFSWETKSLKLSGIVFEIFNLADLSSIRLRKYSSPCNSLLAFHLFS